MHLALAQQDRATDSGNEQLQHVTHIWDKRLIAQQYTILRRNHGQVTKVPDQAPHILQSILQAAGTEQRGPGLVSSSRNRSLMQAYI